MRLEVRNLFVRFGQRSLFEELSFTAESGTLVALVGPSGSGKSTLLGVVAGLLSPTSGEVSFSVNGVSVDRPHLSWVVQSSPLLPRRTVLDNVVLGAWRGAAASIDSTRERAHQLLTEVGIGALSGEKALKLSGGERQRLSIARGLLSDSDLLLVDEPTATLDPISRESVCHALVRGAELGCLVLVATHDPYVARMCNVVIDLDRALAIEKARTEL